MPERQVAEGAGDAPSHREIEQASWLSPSALLLVGPFGQEGRELTASLVVRGESTRLECRSLPLGTTSTDGSDADGVLVVALSGLARSLDNAELVCEVGETTLTLGARELKPLAVELQTVVRRSFAPLDATMRMEVVEFFASILNLVPKAERHELSKKLHSVREALRERLPRYILEDGQPSGLHLDRVMAVDDRSFYLQGWIHDEDIETVRVTAVSPEGSRAELRERMFRYPRPDVAEFFPSRGGGGRTNHGFLCFVELDAPSLLADGWLLEMERGGVGVEVAGEQVIDDQIEVRDAILHGCYNDRLPSHELLSNHVYPAISRIQQEMGMETKLENVVQFGKPPESPQVSIVVPLYDRIDHLEMQLSEFVHDPEISEADLIYVLDSPEQADELLELAAQLTPLYRVPLRIAILEQNVGFAGANNAGASLARGRLLVLLNSDIVPAEPGWTSAMQRFYDSTPNIGALGPKLLYEDDSIQNAGMYYWRPAGSSIWRDAHYYKGMHRSLAAANVARTVPVVLGACLMIDRSLYEEFGGLPGSYVRGDFEDADLCLQLSGRGYENWYVPTVELYHLEGQSYAPSIRRVANQYNMWLHSHIWGERITALIEGT